MSKLVQIINSPFWAAGILTVILLTAGNYKWWLFGIYVLLAFFGKLYIKNNEKEKFEFIAMKKFLKNKQEKLNE